MRFVPPRAARVTYTLAVATQLRAARRSRPPQDRARDCRHDHSGRDVLRHDCAGADERLLADLDPGAEDGAAADARTSADRRPGNQLVASLGTPHEVVVRRDDARCDEDVVLERRVGGDVGARPGSSSASPIVVSFSTSEPRPTTTSSPIATRSRMHDWSPMMTRAPIVVPAKTTAPVETTSPSPSRAGARGSRLAVERGESVGCLPTTAYSSTFTPSPSTVPG